jgi:2-haloacid dehalogenase
MPTPFDAQAIRLLIFDVFGTLVDWRRSVAEHAQRWLQPLGVHDDWLAFANAWRAHYQPAMTNVRSGQRPFCKLDLLHRLNLDVVLAERGHAAQVDEATRQALNLAWHQLDAWPDVGEGLALLRQQHRIAPCSNGNVSLMADLARHNAWHWDAILGAEWARDYKPQPVVYQAAAAAFDCAPHEVLMVAAHSDDLAAAADCGLRTAHVARPDECGPGLGEARPRVAVDLAVGDLRELAQRLSITAP